MFFVDSMESTMSLGCGFGLSVVALGLRVLEILLLCSSVGRLVTGALRKEQKLLQRFPGIHPLTCKKGFGLQGLGFTLFP